MAQLISVKLARFDSSPWGFRLQGGKDFGTPLVIQKVTVGSLAEKAGLQAGDALIRVNDTELFNLRHKDAQDCLVRAGNSFELSVQRGGSTWKPAVTPIGPTPVPSTNIGKVQPVTKTSLAARQAPAPAIASGHNVSARPFAPQVNGSIGSESVKSIVNKQYNSPVGMYSEETIAETLSAQAEVLAGGVLGVNFKKNEKNYNAANSEVFKMVQEIDKEPREPEPEVVAAPSAAPLPVTGLRHVSAPAPSASTTTTPHEPLPPGQNICADCERLIVGVFVRIKDKNLHVECFKCATCGTSLKNVGYYNINNKLYCDIHAKLVARQNPPAPNLEPVTVPPGSRIPAGTISSALSSIRPSPLTAPSVPISIRPLPAAAPLSPSSPQPGTLGPVPFHAPRIGTTHVNAPSPVQTPTGFGGPKPFASVPSPTPARPAPVASKVVWPPRKEDLSNDTPTATPLYIPPNPVPDPKNVTSSSDMLSHTTSHQQFFSNSKNQSTEYFEEGSFLQGESEIISNEGGSSHIKPMLNAVSVMSSTKQETVHFETQSTKKVVLRSNCGLETDEKLIKNDGQVKKYSICSQEVVSCTENKLVDAQMLISNARPTSPIPPEASDIASITHQTNNETNFNKTEIIREQSQNMCEKLYKKSTEENNEINLNAANKQLDTSREEPTQSVTTVNVDVIPNEKQSNELKMQDIRLSEATQSQSKEEVTSRLECKDDKFEHKIIAQSAAIVDQKIENIPIIEQEQNMQSTTIERDTHSLHEEKITQQSKLYSLPIAQSMYEKPQKWQSALTSALTTAPERPFSPFDVSKPQPLTIEGNQILQTSKYSSFASVSNDQTSSLPPQTIPCKPKLEMGLKGVTRNEECPSPLVTALTIAPDRPYSPFISSENQIPESVLPLLPQPKQRISLLSALTIAPEREFMSFPAATKASSIMLTDKTTFSAVQKPTVNVKESVSSSAQKANTSEIINDSENSINILSGNEPLHNFPPISDELKKKYPPNIIAGHSHKPQTPEANSVTCAESIKSCQENIKEVSTLEVSEKSEKSTAFGQQKAYSLTGIPKPATIPYYQKDIERYQIQRALSPAPICKRATSPSHSNTKHSTQQLGPQDPVLKRPIPIKPPSIPLQETSVSSELSKQNPPHHTSDSGLGRPAVIPLYQQDLERFQVQRALSPAPHFKVPGSRSPSPLPIDADSAVRAYKFGAPLRPSSMHQAITESENMSVIENEVKTISEQEHQTSVERISLQKTENMCKMGTSNAKDKQENTPGLGRVATIPQYQKDLERYQILRALSPAPHYKVPGSRSPSPAPINTESLKTAHKFEGSILPKDIHHMSSSMEQKNIHESLKEQMSVFGSSESQEFSVLENQQYMQEEVTLNNTSQSQSTKLTIHGSTSFQPSSGQLKTIPFPNIPFPESGSNHYVTQNYKHETVKSNSKTDLILNTSSNQTQQLPEFIPKIPQLSSFSKASAPVKDPIASVKPQPNSTTIPNAGGGSGKTTASVAGSSAPRRGRGVLNQPSTRIPLCGHCNGQIRGPFITALGKIWCPEHFVCVIPQCRRQLQDIGFVEEKGDLYCEFCFEQYIAPSCDKCTKKIRGDCLNAIGKHFHPECFLCAYCGKLFGNNPFFLEDGLPYCESDWNELFTTKCFACGFPIEAGDRWVEALNNNYHSQCFNCTNCKKNLEGQSFYAKGGRPFCKAHAR